MRSAEPAGTGSTTSSPAVLRESACLICDQERATAALTVFQDDLWAAGVVTGYNVPGWIVLRLRRHRVGFQGLSSNDLATFGRRARDVTEALREVTGAPVTYLMIFGENAPHFHALIAPRTDDVAPDRRSGDILKLRHEVLDAAAALTLVPAIRDAYARHSRALFVGPDAVNS